MEYKSTTVKENKQGWYFKVKFKDLDDFEIVVEGTGYKSEHQAKWWAGKKKNQIVNNGGKPYE